MYICLQFIVDILLVTRTEVADVQKNLTPAIIVHPKIAKEIVVANDQNTSINLKNPKNIHETTVMQVIILALQTTAPIQTIAVIHESLIFIDYSVTM